MFKIKYVFKKGGPRYSCSYPDPKDCNHNIFITKGRNDMGKSTMMQMIALGFYGLNSEDISDILKDKMERLISKDTDECKFDFTIVDKDNKIQLESKLEDSEIIVRVNGKIKNRTYIEDNFKIIFDVPEEPIKKFTSALKSIKDNLSEYKTYTNNYRADIEKLIDKIVKYEEKDGRIKEEKKDLENKKTILENLEKRLKNVKKNFEELERARIVISFEELVLKSKDLDKRRRGLEKQIKKLKDAGIGGASTKYFGYVKEFMQHNNHLKILINTSTRLIDQLNHKEKKKMKTISKEINDIISLKDLNDEKLKKWYKFFDDIRTRLESNPLHKTKMVEEDQIILFNNLISTLKEFIEIEVKIPGTEGKNVVEFLKILEDDKKKLETKISKKIVLNGAIDICGDLLKKLGDLAIVYSKIPKIKDIKIYDLKGLKKQKKSIEDELENIIIKITKMEDQYRSIPRREKILLRSKESWVKRDYGTIKDDKSDTEKKIENLKKQIETKKSLIEELKKITKPPEGNKKELEKLYNITTNILRKFDSYLDYIDSLDLIKMKIKEDLDSDAEKFYMIIADYFANVLKLIYFENKGWKVKKVDFIKRSFIVEGRKKAIEFRDFGMGHTSLNSLLARIKQNYGGRKMIVLFDDIGFMDKNNRSRLINEIKGQIKSGEIIFALLSLVDDELDKVIMEPIKCD